jgi:hypothetical protein
MAVTMVLLLQYKKYPYLTKLVMVLVHGQPHIEPLQEVLDPLGHHIGVLNDLLFITLHSLVIQYPNTMASGT